MLMRKSNVNSITENESLHNETPKTRIGFSNKKDSQNDNKSESVVEQNKENEILFKIIPKRNHNKNKLNWKSMLVKTIKLYTQKQHSPMKM